MQKDQVGLAVIIVGVLTLIVSLAYFSLGLATTVYVTNLNLGSPWAGGVVLLAAILGAFSFKSQCPIISSGVFAGIAFVMSIVGVAVDSVAMLVVGSLKGCINSDTGELFGDEDAAKQGLKCLLDDDTYTNDDFLKQIDDDVTTQKAATDSYDGSQECYCQASDDTDTCFLYTLASGDDCSNVYGEYLSLLTSCVALGVICAVLALTLSIITCCWCGASEGVALGDTAVEVPQKKQGEGRA